MTLRDGVRTAAVLVLAAVLSTLAAPATAHNTSAAYASFLPSDGTTKGGNVYGAGGTIPERWYVAKLRGGRSYSITLTEGDVYGNYSTYVNVTLFASDAVADAPGTTTTTYGSHPDTYASPGTVMTNFAGATRLSYTPAAATNALETVYLRVNNAYLPDTVSCYFRISITETTLFGAWFWAAAPYEAFTQIQNTSAGTITGKLTHYGENSTTMCGSQQSFSVPPFGSIYIMARGTAGCSGGGGAVITHNGPPGSIQANVTCINVVGTGLAHSFNIPYNPQARGPALQ